MIDTRDDSDPAQWQAGADFHEVFNHADSCLAILDRDGRFQWVNSAFLQMLGYTRAELQGLAAHQLTHPADLKTAAVWFESLQRGSIRSYQIPKRWIHKSGHVVSTMETVSGIALPAADTPRFLCHLYDTAQSSPGLLGLLAAERLDAVNEMAIGIAHESRNALQQIGACAEMLAMDLAHLPDALDLIRGMQEAEARLLRLFEDLRVYTMPFQLERHKCEVGDLWRRAWASLVENNPRRKLQLVERVTSSDTHSTVAAQHLERAFLKIFENSLDACEDPVEIEVSCSVIEPRDAPAMSVTLRDSGKGFHAAALLKAFDPFYTTKTQGTGLGLPIVRRIIEAHGGTVHARNHAQCGAIVEFRLPREV